MSKDETAQNITMDLFNKVMPLIQNGIDECHEQECNPVHAVNMLKFLGMGILACAMEFTQGEDNKNSLAEALSGELYLHLKNYIKLADGFDGNSIIIQ
jgi:hypothetical protein